MPASLLRARTRATACGRAALVRVTKGAVDTFPLPTMVGSKVVDSEDIEEMDSFMSTGPSGAPRPPSLPNLPNLPHQGERSGRAASTSCP